MAAQTTIASALKPNGYAPGLAWNGTQATVAYYVGDPSGSNASSLAWLRVDRTGAAAAPPAVVGALPSEITSEAISGTPLATLADKLVLLARPASSLEATKLDGAGATVVAPFGLAHDPNGVREYHLVNRGPDVIAAWTTYGFRDAGKFPGRIGLAKIAP
jgi:hypothetical protein